MTKPVCVVYAERKITNPYFDVQKKIIFVGSLKDCQNFSYLQRVESEKPESRTNPEYFHQGNRVYFGVWTLHQANRECLGWK